MHCKYIVFAQEGREQIVRFPTSMAHKTVASRLNLPVISAGYCYDSDWCGGESETLDGVKSRGQQDQRLLARMLSTTARETWDLAGLIQSGLEERNVEPMSISL